MLQVGTDLDRVSPEVLAAFSNLEVMAIDQDALGQQARRVRSEDGRQVWLRELDGGDLAVALLNSGDVPARIEVSFTELGADAGPWDVRDTWNRADVDPIDATIGRDVAPHDMILLRLSR